MKRKTKHRQTRLKTKLGLPDLEHAKVAVIVSLRSFESQRSYRHSIDEFVGWYCSAPRLFRCMCTMGTIWGAEMTEKVVWHVVKQYAGKVGILRLAPHELRRSCARLCHRAGGELEQIQFLLGHVSVQTTEKYLGCKQRLREAVNDKIG